MWTKGCYRCTLPHCLPFLGFKTILKLLSQLAQVNECLQLGERVWYHCYNRVCDYKFWCETVLHRVRETAFGCSEAGSLWWLVPEEGSLPCVRSSDFVNLDQPLPPSALPRAVPKQKHACYKFPVLLWQCKYWVFHFPSLDFVSLHLLSFFPFPQGSAYVLRLKTETHSVFREG